MIRNRGGFAVLFYCLFVTVVCQGRAAADEWAETSSQVKRVIKVGVVERPFYQEIDDSGQFSGLDIKLSRRIFVEAGFEVEFIRYPWKRILHLIENGELDVALSAADTNERKVYARFSSEPFRTGHNVVFALKRRLNEMQDLVSLQDLKGSDLKVAVLRGVAYSLEYDAISKQGWFSNKLFVVDSSERLVDALLRGRADLYLGSEFEHQHLLMYKGLASRIVPLFYLMTEDEAETHIMFSRKSVPPEWVESVNQAMRRLRKTGEYQEILTRFDPLSMTKHTDPHLIANNTNTPRG